MKLKLIDNQVALADDNLSLTKICSNINDRLLLNRTVVFMKEAIAYYRVSTSRQGRSGLGLEAQQQAVHGYCRLGELCLIDEVIEVKSTRKDRPGLQEALHKCRQRQAALIVARLDRLGRDVEEIAGIVKSDVEIIVVDNPHANRFTIHILAAVAEEHRQRISETTRTALQAAKRRGVVLGKNGRVLSETNRKAALEFACKLSPTLARFRSRGITTIRGIAKELNKRRVPTFRGGRYWYPSTVCMILNRLKENSILSAATRLAPDK